MGETRAARLLIPLAISRDRRVGDLTDRQRASLAERLRAT
jgi:ribosomal protein S13